MWAELKFEFSHWKTSGMREKRRENMRRQKEATGRESRHPTRIGEASVVPISLLASARKNMTSPLSSCGVGLRFWFC